jgi:hypothetical protein
VPVYVVPAQVQQVLATDGPDTLLPGAFAQQKVESVSSGKTLPSLFKSVEHKLLPSEIGDGLSSWPTLSRCDSCSAGCCVLHKRCHLCDTVVTLLFADQLSAVTAVAAVEQPCRLPRLRKQIRSVTVEGPLCTVHVH